MDSARMDSARMESARMSDIAWQTSSRLSDSSRLDSARMDSARMGMDPTLGYEERPTGRASRFTSPYKWIPVIFMGCTINGLYEIFYWYHLHSMLQIELPEKDQDADMRTRGILQIIIFQVVTVLLLICYIRAIVTDPGEIPMDDDNFTFLEDPQGYQIKSIEVKRKDGERRHCKWCGRFKPDRCHHCRACRKCTLRMDHHCPWIYNCVGYHNYKYFFLILFYAVIDLHLMFWCMLGTLLKTWEEDTPLHTMFFCLYFQTLVVFLGTVLTVFFCFHVILMFKGMTTIEFCEAKGRAESDKLDSPTERPSPPNVYLLAFKTLLVSTSAYSLDYYSNIKAVLGPNPLLWLLPCSPPDGDGLSYPANVANVDTQPHANANAGYPSYGAMDGYDSGRRYTPPEYYTPSSPEAESLHGYTTYDPLGREPSFGSRSPLAKHPQYPSGTQKDKPVPPIRIAHGETPRYTSVFNASGRQPSDPSGARYSDDTFDTSKSSLYTHREEPTQHAI